MPRVNIYIRSVDWDRWQSIGNKPEWLHDRINDSEYTTITAEDVQANADRTRQLLDNSASEATCTGHDMRMDCGRPGCKYAL